MKIEIVENVTKQTYKTLLPAQRYNFLNHIADSVNRIVMFSLTDEEILKCYCILLLYKNSSKSVTLFYVHVADEYRGEGLAKLLLSNVINQVRAWGYSNIIAGTLEDEPQSFLYDLSFERLKTEYVMVYTGYTLKNSKAGLQIDKLKPLTKQVKKITELSTLEKKKYRNQILSMGYGTDIDLISHDYSRFYVTPNQEIIASMLIELNQEGNLICEESYVAKREDAKLALPSMIIDLLIDKSNILDDDTRLILTLTSSKNYEAMKESFGLPIREEITNINILKDI